MNIKDAVRFPRFHHQWMPDYIKIEPNAFNDEVIKELTLKGYHINDEKDEFIGRVNAIKINSRGNIVPAADPRGDNAEASMWSQATYINQ